MQIGIRALKAQLSQYVRRAAGGEVIVVTERGRPVAQLVPHRSAELPRQVAELVRRGELTLADKPRAVPKVRGKMRLGSSLTDIVIEERRRERLFR